MKNIKEEKSKKQYKKPEPLNIKATWWHLFSQPMIQLTVPEQYVKELLGVTDKIIADPDSIDHSSQLAGKMYDGKQLSIPLNYNKKVIKFQNFVRLCCEKFIKTVREGDENTRRMWETFTPTIMDMWVVSQYAGGYNESHVHAGTLSGILYFIF